MIIRKQLTRALRAAHQPLHLRAGQPEAMAMPANVVVECGWGRLLPAQTWRDPASIR